MSEKNETSNQENAPQNQNNQNNPETNNEQNNPQENQNNVSQSENNRYSSQNNKNSTKNENTKSTNNLNATSKSNFNKTHQKNPTFNNSNRKKLAPLAVSRTKASFYKTSVPKNNNNFFNSTSYQKPMTTSQINPNQNPDLIDNLNLKEELINVRTEFNNKKQEYNELKIEFGKLLEDNRQNKALIERVLKIDPNEPCTKAEAREKIENAKTTDEEKKELKNALKQIK
jgi:hypothetical protein